jgi:hypothetical protein
MKFTDEQLTEAETFGALSYAPNDICTIWQLNEAEFHKVWNNQDSEFMKRYKRGAIVAQYSIDVMLFNNAQNGDFKALQEYKNRVAQNQKKIKRKSDG